MSSYRFVALSVFFLLNFSGFSQNMNDFIRLATVMCGQGKADSAQIFFDKAYQLDSTSKKLFKEEISCYQLAGKFTQALQAVNRLIALDTTDAESYYSRGIIIARFSKTDSSCIMDFRKALQLKPDYFNAVYNLGAFYYNCNLELKRQVKVCPNPNILTEERKSYMRLAVPYFEEALKLKPDYHVVSNALLSIYRDLGLTEKEAELKEKTGKK